MRVPTKQVLDRLVVAIQAMRFPAKLGTITHPFAGELIFESGSVKIFDLMDMTKAFAELLVFTKRAAFIVIEASTASDTVNGNRTSQDYRDRFTIFCSDRSYKNRELALSGDSTTPGVLIIKDAIEKSIFGELGEGAFARPGDGDIFAITGDNRDEQNGRIGWAQVVIVDCGREDRSLNGRAAVTIPRP